VVTDRGEQSALADQHGQVDGGVQVGGERLLDEHRHSGGDHRPLGRSVRERRHADVDRVRPVVQQGGQIRADHGAVRLGQGGRGLAADVGDAGHPYPGK
jgi:hypothetical protein